MSVNERFKQLKNYEKNFGFLFNISNLKSISDDELLKYCKDLQLTLSEKQTTLSDIDAFDLFSEIKILAHTIPENFTPLSTLRYVHSNRLNEAFPNLSIALRIILTIPVTVATAKRTFSKLKLIKTYLRSTMSQERLSALAIVSIENDIAAGLDYNDVIADFASKKSRKISL